MSAYSIEEYLNLPQNADVWVWKGIIPNAGSVLLFGDPKVGKSMAALGVAEAVADPDAEDFLGLDIQTHGNVLYIQLDTPRSLWQSKYVTIVKSPEARKHIYIIDREMPDLPKQFDIRSAGCIKWLRNEVDAIQPVLVIVDTIRRMHRGNENESDTMAVVLDSFIAACTPAAIMFLAHKKKAQTGDAGNGSVRGSSALAGAVDALVNMAKTRLRIEARSDVEEEMPIYQLDNGAWSLNSQEDDIKVFLAKMEGGTANAKQDEMIAAKFGVSNRTARRWRTSLTGDKG